MTGSFTTIYLPTLSTVGTAIALATVYFARKDRREEVVQAWLLQQERILERIADAIVELADAAEQVHLRRVAQLGQTNPLFETAVLEKQLRPSSVPVSKMKLRAALASLPSEGLAMPKCRALLEAQPDEIAGIPANEALDEVRESLTRIAQARAEDRVRRNHSMLRKIRLRRAWRKAGMGDPYK